MVPPAWNGNFTICLHLQGYPNAMAYDPGTLEAALSAAVGSDLALIAELRRAFLESAERQTDLLARARCDANWTMAALRLKGLCASFGVNNVMNLADEALESAPGDPVILRKISRALAAIETDAQG
jgi:HPt (histidine-containing phosphotransfer) domain-containing protein